MDAIANRFPSLVKRQAIPAGNAQLALPSAARRPRPLFQREAGDTRDLFLDVEELAPGVRLARLLSALEAPALRVLLLPFEPCVPNIVVAALGAT